MLFLFPIAFDMKIVLSVPARRLLIWAGIFIIIILLLGFSVRGIVLRKALSSFASKMKEHHYLVHWEGAEFKGVKSIFIKDIYIQNEDNANEIYVDSLTLNVKVLPMLIKNIRLKELDCRKISVRYLAEAKDTLVVTPVPRDTTGGIFERLAGMNLSDIANSYIHRFFNYVPSKARIQSFETSISYAGKITMIGFHDLKILHSKVTGTLELSSKKSRAEISINGRFKKSSYLAEVMLVNPGDSLLPLPVLNDKYGIITGFDTVNILLDMSGHSRRMVDLSGKFSLSGLQLGGARISSSSIKISNFSSSFLVHVGEKYVELDSASLAYLNKIAIRPYLQVQMLKKPFLQFRMLPVTWNAGDFFSSLPEGMFTSVNGLKASGTLHYFLNFSVDMAVPDSLIFATALTSENFRILEYGADDYRKMNGSFYHEVYEKGKLKTAFIVGSNNPEFVPFDDISPFLRAAVMTSEDGSFFYHNGFNPEAFRESIVTNIKENRFARGGSTLSMQLVKNVFLTRNKTLARKIEEALIVWLIENQNLVPKKRMYEVYLNLIEWGPGIYGISQASLFYFNKPPRDLNLQESIYLASIVPHPKLFRYTFEVNGVPKSFFGNYFRRMEQLMVRKQFIQPSDTNGVNPSVYLTGVAAASIATQDTERDDDLILQQLEIIPATVE
jgi:hypothetical protein